MQVHESTILAANMLWLKSQIGLAHDKVAEGLTKF